MADEIQERVSFAAWWNNVWNRNHDARCYEPMRRAYEQGVCDGQYLAQKAADEAKAAKAAFLQQPADLRLILQAAMERAQASLEPTDVVADLVREEAVRVGASDAQLVLATAISSGKTSVNLAAFLHRLRELGVDPDLLQRAWDGYAGAVGLAPDEVETPPAGIRITADNLHLIRERVEYEPFILNGIPTPGGTSVGEAIQVGDVVYFHAPAEARARGAGAGCDCRCCEGRLCVCRSPCPCGWPTNMDKAVEGLKVDGQKVHAGPIVDILGREMRDRGEPGGVYDVTSWPSAIGSPCRGCGKGVNPAGVGEWFCKACKPVGCAGPAAG